MRFLFGFMLPASVLVLTALAFNAPLMLAARLARGRVRPLVPKVALAVGFAAATAYRLWSMEWFDVWRHGNPPVTYVLGYLPWILGFGAAGWFAGGVLAGRAQRDGR